MKKSLLVLSFMLRKWKRHTRSGRIWWTWTRIGNQKWSLKIQTQVKWYRMKSRYSFGIQQARNGLGLSRPCITKVLKQYCSLSLSQTRRLLKIYQNGSGRSIKTQQRQTVWKYWLGLNQIWMLKKRSSTRSARNLQSRTGCSFSRPPQKPTQTSKKCSISWPIVCFKYKVQQVSRKREMSLWIQLN